MLTPQYLQTGDKVVIVAPAGKTEKEKIEYAVKILNEWGLEVILGKNIFNVHHQFAGTDKERLNDLQEMLDNPDIKAIFCARGGYGTIRIIDKLNFSSFAKYPKWLIGFSDITILHSHIHTNFAIETIHATMPVKFAESALSRQNETLQSLKRALFGEKIMYQVSAYPLNRKGECEGIIIGGNLSVLYSCIGTNSDIDTKNKILFIEDTNEYLYHIDRMIITLRRAGKLENLAGLIVGGFSELKDNEIPFGMTVEEIVFDAVKQYDYPVCFGFSAGHIQDNYALILGRKVKLTVKKEVMVEF